jgi:hypothetical protein
MIWPAVAAAANVVAVSYHMHMYTNIHISIYHMHIYTYIPGWWCKMVGFCTGTIFLDLGEAFHFDIYIGIHICILAYPKRSVFEK